MNNYTKIQIFKWEFLLFFLLEIKNLVKKLKEQIEEERIEDEIEHWSEPFWLKRGESAHQTKTVITPGNERELCMYS